MQFDTKTAAGYAADKLDSLLGARYSATRTKSSSNNDIPTTVAHYAALDDTVDNLHKTSALQKHVDVSELRDPANDVDQR